MKCKYMYVIFTDPIRNAKKNFLLRNKNCKVGLYKHHQLSPSLY